MAKKKVEKPARVAWDAKSVKSLTSLAKKKTKTPEIAAALGRTAGAVRQKAHSLGLSLNTR